MYPEAYMSLELHDMSSHGSLHQFATLRLKTYILARKGSALQ